MENYDEKKVFGLSLEEVPRSSNPDKRHELKQFEKLFHDIENMYTPNVSENVSYFYYFHYFFLQTIYIS
jgi:hypothetical protein